jgi:hypothetical protein
VLLTLGKAIFRWKKSFENPDSELPLSKAAINNLS